METGSAPSLHGTLVVATRDENLVADLRAMNGTLGLCLEVQDCGKKLMEMLLAPTRRTHPLDAEEIRVLLLDDDLADMRGRSLLREVRRARPDLKIVFAVHAPSQALEVEVRREGVYFYLPKPVDTTLLRKVVTKAVEHESTRNRWKVG